MLSPDDTMLHSADEIFELHINSMFERQATKNSDDGSPNKFCKNIPLLRLFFFIASWQHMPGVSLFNKKFKKK
jgi:hypothetical protein